MEHALQTRILPWANIRFPTEMMECGIYQMVCLFTSQALTLLIVAIH